MRLDVLQGRAVTPAEFAHRADLVDDIVDDFLAAAGNLAPSETLQIVEARMRADRHAMFRRQANGFIDQVRIAGVKAGGNVGS